MVEVDWSEGCLSDQMDVSIPYMVEMLQHSDSHQKILTFKIYRGPTPRILMISLTSYGTSWWQSLDRSYMRGISQELRRFLLVTLPSIRSIFDSQSAIFTPTTRYSLYMNLKVEDGFNPATSRTSIGQTIDYFPTWNSLRRNLRRREIVSISTLSMLRTSCK